MPKFPINSRMISFARSTSMQSGLSMQGPHHGMPNSKIIISVKASQLKDVDTFSVSDPFCVMFSRSAVSSKWKEIGRTEVIWNNLAPDWVEKFEMDYYLV